VDRRDAAAGSPFEIVEPKGAAVATIGEALQQARQLIGAGQLDRAEGIYRQLLAAAPQAAELWHEMGLVQMQSGRAQAAVGFLQRATELDPASAAYHSNLGAVYRMLKRTDDAVASFRRALTCGPPPAELCNNLALALKDSGQTDDALGWFDEAVRTRPDFVNAHFNRGNLLLDMGRLDEAIESYRRAADLNPADAGVYCKLGVAYYDQGRLDEALAAFDRALVLQPGYAEVRRNRGLALLAQGNYQQGWSEFAWRLECEGFGKRQFAQPQWDGSPLAGRTLLVHAEQGLGDTLQFIRYVPLVEEAGGRVLVEVQAALVPLLVRSGFGRWIVEGPRAAGFDVQCPLMSLAEYLPDSTGRPFWRQPYLAADPRLVADWGTRLGGSLGFKVGIVWAGNPDHPHDRFRSVRLREFAPLAAIPGVQLISLQKGAGHNELAGASAPPLLDLGEDLDGDKGAFMDTAAVIKHLDLVITVDTSIAHLAGGLGAKVWVALQLSPDWRWLLRGSATAWYPSMRLFRQPTFDCWPPVFQEMAQELTRLIAEPRP
jgi:tetratricopeptide (TPR) repeat protein